MLVDADGRLDVAAVRVAVRGLVVRSLGLLALSAGLCALVVWMSRFPVLDSFVAVLVAWALVSGVSGLIGTGRWLRRIRVLDNDSWWRGRAVLTQPRRRGKIKVNVLDPDDWRLPRTGLLFARPLGWRGIRAVEKVETTIWVGGRGAALTAVLEMGSVIVAVRPDDLGRIEAGLLDHQAALAVARWHRLGAGWLFLWGLGCASTIAVLASLLPASEGDDATPLDGVITALFILTVTFFVAAMVTLLRWHRTVRRLVRRRAAQRPSA